MKIEYLILWDFISLTKRMDYLIKIVYTKQIKDICKLKKQNKCEEKAWGNFFKIIKDNLRKQNVYIEDYIKLKNNAQ